MLYFTLYDQEVRVDQITKMRQMRYIQNRYLGTFKIPLTTVLSESKIEGLMRIDRPLVLQDYHVVQDELIFKDPEDFKLQQACKARNEEQIPTYINISIQLEPLISISRDNEQEFYPGYERGPFLQAGNEWIKAYQRQFNSERVVKLFLENLDGQSVFVSKYLSPLKPPSEIYSGPSDKKAIEKCARFVSLIPYVDDSVLFRDMPNLACSCQEFLDLGMGDTEEHAILLCNYFNYIDRDQGRQNEKGPKNYHSYVIYGEAIPDGDTWYVCRRDCINNFVEIWSPQSA